MACRSTCHGAASRKDGSSLTAWGVSKMIYSTEGRLLTPASQFYRCRLHIMSAVWGNKWSAAELPFKNPPRQQQKIIRLRFYLPPPFISRGGWDMRLHGSPTESPWYRVARNNQYALLRARRKGGWGGDKQLLLRLPVTSFLEQGAASQQGLNWGRTVHCA